MGCKIKTGDRVVVISGRDKGKVSVVKSMIKSKDRAVVEGVNYLSFFQKGSDSGVVRKEGSVHVSNLAHVDPVDGKAVKVSVKIENGKKLLISKRSGKVVR